MRRFWSRVLPAVLAGLAMVPAALVPLPRAHACCPFSAPSLYYPRCDSLIQRGGGSSTFTFGPGAGITQPIYFGGNVAACSLTIQNPGYSSTYSRLEFVQWDPLALAPDPTTVALISRSFAASELSYNHLRVDFNPPVVLRTLQGVADPPGRNTALDFVVSNYGSHTAFYDPAGPTALPTALQHASGGPRTPLPGTHAVLSHAACGGDAFLQGLCVAQSVMTANALSDTGQYELIQRIRVPVSVRLRWIELAFGTKSTWGAAPPGVVAIVDAQGAASPPLTVPATLVEAFFSHCDFPTPVWGSHYDFDRLINLDAGHDYWLLARVVHTYPLYERALTGTEGTDFSSAIGPLFERTAVGAAWSAVPDRSLSFRLIGEPLDPVGTVGVGPPAAVPSKLMLRVSPNPARGSATVAWSGVTGSVRLDVLDARGRRVACASRSGTDGRWTWRGGSDDGRLVPSGAYFVRATDSAGRASVQRFVLVR